MEDTITCPSCFKTYLPELTRFPVAMLIWQRGALIQDAFPRSTAEQREQIMTGICSDACWDRMCGGDE